MEYDRQGRVVEKSNSFIHMKHVYSISSVVSLLQPIVSLSYSVPFKYIKTCPSALQFLDSTSSSQFSESLLVARMKKLIN